jgi:hypothetical protein
LRSESGEVLWTRAGDFTAVNYEAGDEWERILDEPPPDIPFD